MNTSEKTTGFSYLLGALIGAMSVLKYVVPIIFVILSGIFGAREISKHALRLASGVILFCVIQLVLGFYHDGFEFIENGSSHVMLFMMIFSTPMVGMLISQQKNQKPFEVGLLSGSFLSICMLMIDYFYFGICRSRGFLLSHSINPLLITFTLSPIVLFTSVTRLEGGRYNIFDFLLGALIIVSACAFSGSRTGFYTLTAVYLFLTLIFLLKRQKKFSGLMLASVTIGLSLTYLADYHTGCKFFKRVNNQAPLINLLKTSEEIVEKFEAPILPSTPTPAKANQEPDQMLSNEPAIKKEDVISKDVPKLENSSAWRIRLWYRFFIAVRSPDYNFLIGEGRILESHISRPFGHFHNQFLSIVYQGGILGVFSMLLLIYPLIKRIFESVPTLALTFAFGGQLMTNSSLNNSATLAQFLISILFCSCVLYVYSTGDTDR